MGMSPDTLFDNLLKFTKALGSATSEEETTKLIKDFQASNADGDIDYERGIHPYPPKEAREKLAELKLDMIEYDTNNLIEIATSDPVMFKLIYDTMCDCIATLDQRMYTKWWEDWFLAETETRALTYYEQYEQFREDTAGYGYSALNDFYSRNQYNSRMIAFVFTVKRRIAADIQPIIKYCSFIELPAIWSEEKEILSKTAFLYAYNQYNDQYDYDYV